MCNRAEALKSLLTKPWIRMLAFHVPFHLIGELIRWRLLAVEQKCAARDMVIGEGILRISGAWMFKYCKRRSRWHKLSPRSFGDRLLMECNAEADLSS